MGRQGAPRVPAAGAADLPGPVRDAEPQAHDRRVRRRAARRQQHRQDAQGARRARGRRARVRGHAPGRRLRRPLSPRAVGRATAARRDRRGPRDEPGARGRRRARVDARRVDPHRAPAPDARPPARTRAHLPVHHPRPVAGVGAGRPDRRDVPRPDHGDRAGGAGHPRAAEPVHAGAGLGQPVTGPARRRPVRQADDPRGRDARRGPYPARDAASIPAARSRSTDARWRSRP